MARRIPLTKGHYTLVDDEDYDWLSTMKWQWSRDRAVHTYRENRRTLRVHMSRLVMNCPPEMVVDHINRDSLDNRRENLRICSSVENNRNRRLNVKKSSRFIGVHFRKNAGGRKKLWCAYIWHEKHHLIGYFMTEDEAALARDAKAKELFGEFALLNFPVTKGADVTLKFCPDKCVPSCKTCQRSDHPNRKDGLSPEEVSRI